MNNIFKDKAKEEGASITDLEILVVLITELLRRDLNKLVNQWNQWNYKMRGS
jgi:hypothetical protein